MMQRLMLSASTQPETISYEKSTPWKVKVQAKKPFMLSFAEAYPLWKAEIYLSYDRKKEKEDE
jgi:hypothetical protein